MVIAEIVRLQEVERDPLRVAAPDLLAALRPLAAACDAYINVMRNFHVTGDTEAQRRMSEGERGDTAKEAAFDVLAGTAFEQLAAARAAVDKAEDCTTA